MTWNILFRKKVSEKMNIDTVFAIKNDKRNSRNENEKKFSFREMLTAVTLGQISGNNSRHNKV